MYILFVVIIGFLLRVFYLNKPEGLWNDEYVSWMIAATPFSEGFWSEVFKQCHMPLYYLYLKLFGNVDIILRLSSVIPGVFSIWVMYLVGKEHSSKVAKITAIITSISSFLIYYSQEVRFYSLLFLFSALCLLFLIKAIKHPIKKNFIGYVICSSLIVFTHTIGFVFVLLTTLYLISKIRLKKEIIVSFTLILLASLLASFYIFSHVGTSQWWGTFTYKNIVFMFTDFFSPILTNNVNVPSEIFYKKEPLFIIYLIIPTIIALCSIFFAAIKNKNLRPLLLISIATTIILAIAAILGKLVFITKYNIEILPILIYLFAIGISLFKKNIGFIILILWSVLQISYLGNNNYPTKIARTEGNRIPAILLSNAKLTPKDKLIFTYYNYDRFIKYIDVSKINHYSIDKGMAHSFVSNNGNIPQEIYIFDRTFLNSKLDSLINTDNRTLILFLDSVSFFTDDLLEKYIKSQKQGIKIHELYIVMSVLKNEIYNYGKKHNLGVKSTKLGSWTLLEIGG